MSDFQEIVRQLQEHNTTDLIQADMVQFMTPKDYANILCKYSCYILI